METVGDRLREWRKKNNISARKIFAETGISTGLISAYETNKKQMTTKTLIALWSAYKFDITWLLTGQTIPCTDLTENEKEMLLNFQVLPEREQIKFIGKLEEEAKKYLNEGKSSNTQIG